MSAFLKSILTLAVISGIASSILSSAGAIKRYVSYFISLIMILVIITPVFNLLSSFDRLEEYINDFTHSIKTEEIINNSNRLIINNSERLTCEGIEDIIITKFGFDESDVLVSLECDKSDISAIEIKAVNVVLTNKASWADIDSVKEYLDRTIGCKINVIRR